ncbi:NAD-dependent epimerase/dehydratase family protein [Robiginitalea marina]|uniref:NAD-dependent epimerase/dehydratase family protein n=1 Tax=Robiginitalea marina TaxID=2954105 RepID=A0ABT1AWY9_9FLAO|nr:NAD-dependent epimerase/dehydratase family protein [Robiginitalea marina]MCO5724563.1 NAD-dependent epimerase/dehydratase family protein [Robiginitalea marina]
MILITGGSGLVGSHILLDLLKQGQEVRALFRPQSNLERVQKLFSWYGPEAGALFGNIQWVQADLTDLPSLEDAFRGVSEVYHCGALISFDPRDADRLLKTNLEGTRNVVNLCIELGISHLHYTSSIAAVGGLRELNTEEDHWDPSHTNVYATSKYLAEMEVWRGAQEGLQTTIVNPGIILGPGFWHTGSGRFFLRAAKGARVAPPGGTGFVGVWDVVRALGELKAAGRYNERFILVAEHLEYRDLLTRIALKLGAPVPKAVLGKLQLEALWRMDWVRVRLGGGKRRLSRAMARSLNHPVRYSSEKIKLALGFEYQSIETVLDRCIENFSPCREDSQSS